MKLLTLLALLFLGISEAGGAPLGAADEKFREGERFFNAGNYGKALASYQESFSLESSPNTHYKVALCYEFMKKYASAYIAYDRTAREAKDRSKKEPRFLATVQDARRQAERLDSLVPRLKLLLPKDIPQDTKLRIDDEEMSIAVSALPLDPGEHRIVIEGPQVKSLYQKVVMKVEENLTLPLNPEVIPTATLILSFPSKPAGLAVWLDDQPLPPERLENRSYVEAGRPVKVVATAPGLAPFEWKRTLSAKEVRNVRVDFSPLLGTPRWAFALAAVGTAVALGVGIGFGVEAKQTVEAEKVRGMNEPLLYDAAAYKQAGNQQLIANIGFGVAGATGIASIVLAFTTRWRSEPSSKSMTALRLAPTIQTTARSSMLIMEGTF